LDISTFSKASKIRDPKNFYDLFLKLKISLKKAQGIRHDKLMMFPLDFGQGHDSKYGNKTIESTPENGVAVMDRGFCSLERIRELQQEKDKYFVLRLKNNIKLEMLENGNYLVGTGQEQVEVRVVWFCDREEQTEFRLVTNLSEGEEKGISNRGRR
jgi:putative transposase